MICFILASLIVLPTGSASSVDDSIPHTIRHDFYTVEGDTISEILQSLKERAPSEYHAYTEWHINWNYTFCIEPTECQLKTFDLHVDVRYTLPQWEKSDGSSKAVVDEWKRYIDAVVVHEEGHTQLAMDAAKEMLELVQSQNWKAGTKEQLIAKVDKACQNIIDKYRELEIQYDKETDHGRTQGARLLPIRE